MRDYSFGNFISTLRERKGLSQYQLGVLVDVSDKAVSKWENGESEPSIDKLIKLSKYFGVNIDESMSLRSQRAHWLWQSVTPDLRT